MNKSIQLVYFLAFLPFVNFGISLFNSDTQPFYLTGVLFILLKNFKSLVFKKKDLILLSYALVATITLLIVGNDSGKNINLVAMFIALFFFQRYTYNLNLLRGVLVIYSLFFVLWIVLPNLAYDIQINLVRNINSIGSSYRGISVLSTEPGLYSGAAVILLELFFLKLNNKFKTIDYVLIFIISSSIILSFSGTSIIFLGVFIFLRIKSKLSFLIILLAVFLVPNFLISLFPESRLSYFLNILNFNNFNLIFLDVSLMYRISSLMVSLEFFANNILGGLLGENVTRGLQDLYVKRYYNPFVNMGYEIRMVSSLGYVIANAGVFSFFFFVNLIKNNFSLRGVLYFILCLCFSYSLIFPLTLILLAESLKKNKLCVEY